jgi:four helix bundle protein
MATHKELQVWKKGIEFVKQIYQMTQLFPKEEFYGLSNQMRRSAVSIPSNIAEGYGRLSNKEIKHFLYIALGSASELETQLIISKELKFTPDEVVESIDSEINEIIKMLASLIKTIFD